MRSLRSISMILKQAGLPAGVSCNGDPDRLVSQSDLRLYGLTSVQEVQATAILTTLDWSDAAEAIAIANMNPDRKALRDAASQAVTDNNTFAALVSPSNAQVVAQVKRLTQQSTALIKRLIQMD